MNKMSKHSNWVVALMALAFWLSSMGILALCSGVAKGFPKQQSEFLTVGLACVLTFLLSLIFVRWSKLSLADIGAVPGSRTGRHLAIGLAIGLILALLHAATVWAFGHLTLTVTPGVSYGAVLLQLLFYLLIAGREELAFRGYPLRIMDARYGLWAAQISIALLFAIEHRIGGQTWLHAFLGPAVGALLFGMASIKTRGLAMPIGIHSTWNFGQWLLGFKPGGGVLYPEIESGYADQVDLTGTIVYLVIIGIAIVALSRWRDPN